MSWFYLALLSPLLFAVVNLIDDNLLQHFYKGAHIAGVVAGLFGIIPAALILLLGLNKTSLSPQLIALTVASGFITTLGYYFYFKGLEKENPSVVAALFSLTPAAIPFIAYFLVGERLSLSAAIGFAILLVATFIYSLSDVKKLKISKALIPVVTAAIIFDISALANKYVYTKADFYSAYLYFSIGLFLGGLELADLLRRGTPKAKLKDIYNKNTARVLPIILLVELVGLAAEFTRDRALSLGSVSLVTALENLQPFYILFISVALFPFFPKFFREAKAGNTRLKFALSATMIAGVYIAMR